MVINYILRSTSTKQNYKRSNILCTNHLASQVHNITNRHIGNETGHPKIVVQRRHIPIVSEVIRHRRRRGGEVIHRQELVGRYILAGDVVKTAGQVGRLPLPPQPVEVRMMKKEDTVCIAISGSLVHLARVALPPGLRMASCMVPPMPACAEPWGCVAQQSQATE